jgi:hypothetical protein
MDTGNAVALAAIALAAAFLAGTLSLLEFRHFRTKDADIYQSLLFYREVSSIPVYANFSANPDTILGVSTDTDRLHFGSLPAGTASKKSVILKNKYASPVRIRLIPDREVAPIMKFSKNNFVLGSYGEEKIEIRVSGPEGSFAGRLAIEKKRPVYTMLDWAVWLI